MFFFFISGRCPRSKISEFFTSVVTCHRSSPLSFRYVHNFSVLHHAVLNSGGVIREGGGKGIKGSGGGKIFLWTCASPIAAFSDDADVKKVDEVLMSYILKENTKQNNFSSIKSNSSALSLESTSEIVRMKTKANFPKRFSSDAKNRDKPQGSSNEDIQPKINEIDWKTINDKIENLVTSNKVVLFMKGTPDAPMCGFSARVVRILEEIGIDDYTFVDVLKHPAVREGVKKYANWPTIPQLYLNGEFIGGCDVLNNLHSENELSKLFMEEKKKKNDECEKD